MAMFDTVFKNLGEVKVGNELTIDFPYQDISLITRLETSCDCTNVYNFHKEQKIVVKYEPRAIPPQIVAQGKNYYAINKRIIVSFTSDTYPGEEMKQVLTFTGTVHE